VVSAKDAHRAREVAARTCVALVAWTSLIALAAPAQAYVVKRTPSGRAVRWERSPLEVQVSPDLVPGLGGGAIRRAARRAGRAWEGHGAPTFVVSDDSPPAQYRAGEPGVQVVRRSPWPHARRFLALTVTLYDEQSGRLIDADVLINPSRPIGEGGDAYDLQAVLTHELGHVLGLEETDADSRATMWPNIPRGETHQRSLAEDDVRGVRAIYSGQRLQTASGCGRASVAPARPAPWPLLLIVALWRWRAEASRRRWGAALALAAMLLAAPAAVASGAARAVTLDFDPAFAGATALGAAVVTGARVGDDGLFRTTVEVDGARVEVLGGCVGGVCQQVGPSAPPVSGERVILAPATGAWAHVERGVAHGGWLGHARRMPVERTASPLVRGRALR